jgi:hypothetical protein
MAIVLITGGVLASAIVIAALRYRLNGRSGQKPIELGVRSFFGRQ